MGVLLFPIISGFNSFVRHIPWPHGPISTLNIQYSFYQRTEMKFSISNASGFQWRIEEFTIGRCVFYLFKAFVDFLLRRLRWILLSWFSKKIAIKLRASFFFFFFSYRTFTILKVSFVLTVIQLATQTAPFLTAEPNPRAAWHIIFACPLSVRYEYSTLIVAYCELPHL